MYSAPIDNREYARYRVISHNYVSLAFSTMDQAVNKLKLMQKLHPDKTFRLQRLPMLAWEDV